MGKITPRLFLKRFFVTILILLGGFTSYSFIDHPSAELLSNGVNNAKNRNLLLASSSSFTGTITVLTKNITVQLDASGHVSISDDAVDNGSSSSTGANLTFNTSKTNFDCSNVGTNNVTLTVTGSDGSSNSGNAVVTVQDNITPTATAKNITLQLDANGEASINAGDVDNGSSDACGIASMSVSPNSFNCSDVGTKTVTLTVKDNNGNTSTDTATVTVEDNVAPTTIAKDISVQLDASGAATITANDINNGSNDACGIASMQVSKTSFDCSNVGANTVTLTVKDNNGNTNADTATVTVEDNVAPTAIAKNITIQLDANGAASINVGDVDNGSMDPCGIASMSVSPNSFTCSDVGTKTVTLTVKDNNGNTSTDTATVTVEDNVAPTAIAKDITVQLDASGGATITADDIDDGSNDACGIASMQVSKTSFDCSNVGANTVTLTVKDNNGKTSTDTATVTVEDNVAPTAIAKDITVQLNASGAATITANDINNGSNDACGIASIQLSKTSFDCSNVGANTVILTVTDNNGKTSTDTATVTVEDNVAPTAIAKDITVQLDASGAATITVNDINNGSNDACGIASMQLSKTSFDCSNVGANTVTLTVTDNNGKTSTATATVTVEDNEDPVISCIADQNKDTDTGACDYTVQGNEFDPSSYSDNCSEVTIKNDYNNSNSLSGAVFPKGSTTVIWTVTDASNNTNTCSFDVTVSDNEIPVISAGDDKTVNNDLGTCTATVSVANATASDNCGVGVPAGTRDDGQALDAPYPVGTTIITWEVSDNNGNAATPVEQKITIKDNEAPVPPSLSDITWGCEYTVEIPVATDNCGNQYSSIANRSTTFSSTGTITWTFTDDAGNSSTATQKITISPVAAEIDKVDVLCHGAATGEIHITASGGIEPYTYTWNSLGTGADQTGLTAGTYTVTVSDANGCSTSPISVTITEPEQLQMTDPQVVPVTCNGANNGEVQAGNASGGVPGYLYKITDNSSGQTWNYQATGKFSDLKPGDYTLTVQDNNGCTLGKNFTITEPAELNMEEPSSTEVTCFGGNNGTVTTGNVTGGNGDYLYSINNTEFGTSNTFTGLTAGTHTIFVKDAKGCALQKTVTVTEPEELSAIISVTNVKCYDGDTGAISVNNASGGHSSYEYSIDGSTWQTSNQFSGLSKGTYAVFIRDKDYPGCAINLDSAVTITQPSDPVTAQISTTRTTEYGSSTGTATANASGGTPGYTYEWRKKGESTVLQTTKTATNLAAGYYEVTVTDKNGCQFTTEVRIIDTILAVIIPTSICDDEESLIRTSYFEVEDLKALGGVGPYTYKWNFGTDATPATATGPGSHQVKYSSTGNKDITLVVTDSLNVSKTFTFTQFVGECYHDNCGSNDFYIESYYVGDANGNRTTAINCADGAQRYLYVNLSNNSTRYSLYAEFTYTITHLDSGKSETFKENGCFYSKEAIPRNAQTIALDWTCGDVITVDNIYLTFSNNDNWTCGQGPNPKCFSTNNQEVVISPLYAKATPNELLCYGSDFGEIEVHATGGKSPYQYSITSATSGFQSDNVFSGLKAGDYNVWVKDSDGTIFEIPTVTIKQPDSPISLTFSVENPLCFGETGTATVSATGGTPFEPGQLPGDAKYKYLWNDPTEQETATATGLTAGEYTVTVIDANGCQMLETVTITQPAQLTEANAGEDQTFGCGFTSTTLNANTPEVGEGSWSIGEGSDAGGEFSDPAAPDSEFSAPDGGTFYLHWTIANANCSNEDEVVVQFKGNCSTLDFDGVDDHISMGDSYGLTSGSFTLEAWVKPKAVDGIRTVLSKRNSSNFSEGGYDLIINNGAPTFRWGNNAVSTSYKIGTDRWYHLAVVYQNSKARLYVDGIEVGNHSATNPAAISSSFLIGAMYNPSNPDVPKNYFKGWIEEVRIWKTALSVEQLHILMNQRLQEDGSYAKGTVLPTSIPGNPLWSTSYPTWSSLAGYYQLLVSDITADGYTPDLASTAVNGKLKNIETIQENTAPVPYTLYTDNQEWFNKSSWKLPSNYNGQTITARDVWDPPSSPGITGDTIAWNIVDLNSKSIKNVGTTNNSNSIDLLGLLDNGGTLKMNGTNNTSGNGLTVTHYLGLDGVIDLEGESQLIQSTGSIATGSGHIEKDQQGTESSFNYNYWSSPVVPSSGDLNYTVAEVMFDGTTTGTNQWKPINFNGQYWWADGPKQNPIKISDYWINTFRKKKADEYSDWERIGSNTDLKIGEGYTMKGTSGAAAISDPQNYTFKGFPNNGDITLSGIAPEQNYLIGNPYPSAISADEFILDHLAVSGGTNSQNVFNGTIYYWDHFSGYTHYLQRYIGGYAMYNLSGGVKAIAIDDRINNTNDEGSKQPGPYIPVAQSFFINTATGGSNSETDNIQGGDITFKNKYRVYVPENNSNYTQFLKPAEHTKEQAIAENKFRRDNRYKIRLKFHSPTGYLRELLVTADANTTNGVDLGYDAPLLDTSEEDMFWVINGGEFAIQGVPNFNIDQVLPLGVITSEKGDVEIKIEELENLPDNISIYLRDNSDSTYFDLRKDTYKAEIDPGRYDSRYDIVFDDGSKKLSQQESEEENLGVAYLRDKHQIELNNPDLLNIEQVYIYGISGQEIEAFYDVQSQKKILLDLKKPLSTSVYIVKVYSGEKIISKKIIIKE